VSLATDLSKKTVFELKSYAKKNNIDLYGVSTKAEILEVILCFVPKETNIDQKVEDPAETVAVFATHSLRSSELGELTKGYNIVTKEKAKVWLKHKAVRSATPEEVAREYRK
jgi:hypothetical protein